MSVDRSMSWKLGLLWMAAGGLLVLMVAVDPLNLHGLDDWFRSDSGAGAPMEMSGSAADAGGESEVLFYRNPMDPTITSPVPMQDEMGMDYIPVYADGASGQMAMGGEPVVSIDPVVVQNMNVRTAAAELRSLEPAIRTVGSLEVDAERVVTVTTRFSGFVEKVYVNYVGESVRRGQALFEVYSPELVQTQQELLSALQYADRLGEQDMEARHHANQLTEAARTRLGYWDISAEQIERLESEGQIQRTLTVTAPSSGVVLERMPGLEGMAVRPGMEAYRIVDLSTLWVGVELFENQIVWAREGTPAEVVFDSFPAKSFSGVVRFIEPELSPESRTLKVKVAIRNPELRLRPGMFATVHFQPPAEEPVVAVPSESVIRTGSRALVIVDLGEGRFQPREVHLGREAGGWSEVHGVDAGERVVTSSQFLIDSEASIQAVVQGMLSGGGSPGMEAMDMDMDGRDPSTPSMGSPPPAHTPAGMTNPGGEAPAGMTNEGEGSAAGMTGGEVDNTHSGHEPRTPSHEPRSESHEPRSENHEPRATNHEGGH